MEAQVYRRRHRLRRKDGIAEPEESVGPAIEATIKRAMKGAQDAKGCEGFHERILLPAVAIGHSGCPSPTMQLKRNSPLKKRRRGHDASSAVDDLPGSRA